MAIVDRWLRGHNVLRQPYLKTISVNTRNPLVCRADGLVNVLFVFHPLFPAIDLQWARNV